MRTERGRTPFRWALVAATGSLVLPLAGATSRPAAAQNTVFDPRFDEIRRASVAWDNRPGPARRVVDMVCLVPDLATFLDVVATWDEGQYFPVLIDDVEYTFKFLRAFRPARVVRYGAKNVTPLGPGEVWGRAVAAVGKAWAGGTTPDDKAPPGDAVPPALGPVPPGVVLSHPESPRLAAAVALAAGRFQPLVLWETPKHYADVLAAQEARDLAQGLEALVAGRFPRYDQLGDDCDFVTLAGDYPYRYNADGLNAFDDLILRNAFGPRRWAFAGRIAGDAARSTYQAMCSLFLNPGSALLFNGYTQKEKPWTDYAMDTAYHRLSPFLKVNHRNGERADLPGWHRAFDPINPYGLVLVNTHGSATVFHLDAGPGQTADIPESVPAAVLVIHSYSAESPDDPETIAGRWLANGAYAYFGSVNEPYLQAFRGPGLVASFLAENLPVVTAVRQTQAEVAGRPWRLAYFGDPLFRIKPAPNAPARLAAWEPVASWDAYREFQQPGAEGPEDLRLKWALRTAIFLTQTGARPQQPIDLPGVLLGIARDRVDPTLRPLYDDLLVDTLLQAGRAPELINRLEKIAPPERSPSVRRHLETAQTAALQRAATARNERQALALWAEVVRAPGSRDFARTFTERVGRIEDESPVRLGRWRELLHSTLGGNPDPANVPVIQAELKRVSEKAAAAKGQ